MAQVENEKLILEIPGLRGQRIKLTKKRKETTGTQARDFLLKMDNLFSTGPRGFEEYCDLIDIYWELKSTPSNDTADPSSKSIHHSELVVLIPTGPHEAVLEMDLYKGAKLGEVTILKLININETLIPKQKLEFQRCQVIGNQPKDDLFILNLKIDKRLNTLYKYGPNGEKEGQIIAGFDFVEGTVLDE
ncbi:MAG: hypothetical protein ACTSXG_02410 [Alphaproteobacteria bacterium]